ncbi:hypothetical protein FRB94_010747 [Tulasnella sp. JGI-2019a]|nr:hypothetical protein FRB94_010747 [Tulasnella sp. JGI-2019a]KAG9012330.1 hypothetical protein FRB93_001752 [Tulasnella sp. JGI-2019a]KAG9036168.1 hypothetical protein FRB95_009742 [Tulasnella sp. JGI-2019a]
MDNQISRQIGERFTRLSEYFSYQQAPKLDKAHQLWAGLVESLNVPPNVEPTASWLDVLEYDLITKLLELLLNTIQLDTKVTSLIAHSTVYHNHSRMDL